MPHIMNFKGVNGKLPCRWCKVHARAFKRGSKGAGTLYVAPRPLDDDDPNDDEPHDENEADPSSATTNDDDNGFADDEGGDENDHAVDDTVSDYDYGNLPLRTNQGIKEDVNRILAPQTQKRRDALKRDLGINGNVR
ncbi:hypothetical protein QFC22_006293 [Naganishia vaughanmartiniae]|uniref:Uncharacterized protein n=1 Tax=Naganishia vaughanmartiniae TaxID=1424756 RepID=A0ACC2WM68_9TREE|nr:hypothetical protein QFC22_006293 [Naganishia vaughanmartiniae]